MEYIWLILVLIVSVWYDIKTWKIPNSIIVAGYSIGIIKMAVKYSWNGIGIFFLGSILPIILLVFLQKGGIIGGGDVKLLSVIGGYYGTKFGVLCILYSFLSGAVLAFLILIFKKNFRKRFQKFFQYIVTIVYTKTLIPYYNLEEDKYEGVMHFSIAIFIAVSICLYQFQGLLL